MFITTYSEFVLKETLKTHDIDLTIDKTHDELSLLRFNFDIKRMYVINTDINLSRL